LFIVACNEATTAPAAAASSYMAHLEGQRWAEAYTLTTCGFQKKIPLAAFQADFELSVRFDSLVSFEIGETWIQGNLAEVDVHTQRRYHREDTPRKVVYSLVLFKETGGWRVDPDWRRFLTAKLHSQPPLAELHYNDVAVSLRYILLQPGMPPMARIRLDIDNQSRRFLL